MTIGGWSRNEGERRRYPAARFAGPCSCLTLPSTTNTTTQRVAFPSWICGEIDDIPFIPYDFESFGCAVFKLSLYEIRCLSLCHSVRRRSLGASWRACV
jgi:hypothetical protein